MSLFGSIILFGIFLCVKSATVQPEISHTYFLEDQQETQNRNNLRTHLLSNYDTRVVPMQVTPVATKVGVGMSLNYFELDESQHIFYANVWMRLSWTDPRLQYNASVAGGSNLRFGADEIWKPDLLLYNNAFPSDTGNYGDTHLLVTPDGQVMWVPPARFASHCTLNMIRWPFDTQTCTLKFGTWTHHGEEIEIYVSHAANGLSDDDALDGITVEIHNFVANSEWQITAKTSNRTLVYFSCCPEPYLELHFNFTFRRKSPSYVVTFVIPIIFLSLMNMLVLWLPPKTGERVILGGIEFFILCVYLLYIESKVPALGDHIPLLVLLYVINLIIVSVTLVISVLVFNLTTNLKPSRPPKWSRVICNPLFVKLLQLGHLLPYISSTHSRLDDGLELGLAESIGSISDGIGGNWQNGSIASTNHYSGNQRSRVDTDSTTEWILFATVIDRITFVVYIFLNIVLLFTCLT